MQDQVSAVRDERTQLASQLAQRQAVLDELRHQLAKQGGVRTGASATPAAAHPSAYRHSASADLGNGAGGALARGAAGACVTGSLSSPRAAWPTASSGAGAGGSSYAQSPGRAGLSSSTLAQDMASLSAQHAGLRNTLSQFDQQQQHQSGRLGVAAAMAGASAAGGSPFLSGTALSRGGASGAGAGGSPYLGLFSNGAGAASRSEYLSSGSAAAPGGAAGGRYSRPSSSPSAKPSGLSYSYDFGASGRAGGYGASGSQVSPTGAHLSPRGGTAQSPGLDLGGSSSSSLGVSQERWAKLGM